MYFDIFNNIYNLSAYCYFKLEITDMSKFPVTNTFYVLQIKKNIVLIYLNSFPMMSYILITMFYNAKYNAFTYFYCKP